MTPGTKLLQAIGRAHVLKSIERRKLVNKLLDTSNLYSRTLDRIPSLSGRGNTIHCSSSSGESMGTVKGRNDRHFSSSRIGKAAHARILQNGGRGS